MFVSYSVFHYITFGFYIKTERNLFTGNIAHKVIPKENPSWDITPLIIDSNFAWESLTSYSWCSGNGTLTDPYIIENITINGLNSGICLSITSTTVYFIVKNSRFYNAGTGFGDCGIKIDFVINGKLINNNCSGGNYDGIYIIRSSNIKISNNNASYNEYNGINIIWSTNITVSDNEMNHNGNSGIALNGYSDYNISNNIIIYNDEVGLEVRDVDNSTFVENSISNNDDYAFHFTHCNNSKIFENVMNNQTWGIISWFSHFNNISLNNIKKSECGVHLSGSNNNTISYNSLSNNRIGIELSNSHYNTISHNYLKCHYECFIEYDCIDNIFVDNVCEPCTAAIPGYDICFFYTIIFITTLSIIMKVKYRGREN